MSNTVISTINKLRMDSHLEIYQNVLKFLFLLKLLQKPKISSLLMSSSAYQTY